MKLAALGMLCASSLLLGGCFGASNDPHEGGLFGYSPSAYEARQQQKKQEIGYLEEENRRQQADTASLNQEKQHYSQQIADLERQNKSLRQDLSATDKKLRAVKGGSAEQQQRLKELLSRRQQIDNSSKKLDTLSEDKKREELKHLQKELRDLEKEADALSRM